MSRQSGISPLATIAPDCSIAPGVSIGAGASIGEGSRIEEGATIGQCVRLGARVVVGAKTVIGDPSYQPEAGFVSARIESDVVIGPNAVVGLGSVVGAGSWIAGQSTLDGEFPPRALIDGDPAIVNGHLDRHASCLLAESPTKQPSDLAVNGVSLIDLKLWSDLRGDLAVLEFGGTLPFPPQRLFTVSNVPFGEVRGLHAHRTTNQLLLCVRGSCQVLVDDGSHRTTVALACQKRGLLMGPLVWGAQLAFSHDAVLVVLASAPYDIHDYIQRYDVFCELTRCHHGGA